MKGQTMHILNRRIRRFIDATTRQHQHHPRKPLEICASPADLRPSAGRLQPVSTGSRVGAAAPSSRPPLQKIGHSGDDQQGDLGDGCLNNDLRLQQLMI